MEASMYKTLPFDYKLARFNMLLLKAYEINADGGSDSPFHAPLDVYWLLIQNFIYAIDAELGKSGKKWQQYADNSVDFICMIKKFPLELKKSYVDQLCEIDVKMKKYVYSSSRSKELSRLLQELDYIKK